MSATNRGAQRRKNDFYETPEWCLDALVESEPLVGPYFDPCCGNGAIVRFFDERGEDACGADIDPELIAECSDLNVLVADFFVRGPTGFGAIVMNPPYKDAANFIRYALTISPPGRKVAALLRLNFLGSSRKRLDLFDRNSGFRAVHVLARRPSFTGNGRTDACDYAWAIWESGYQGSATVTVVKP